MLAPAGASKTSVRVAAGLDRCTVAPDRCLEAAVSDQGKVAAAGSLLAWIAAFFKPIRIWYIFKIDYNTNCTQHDHVLQIDSSTVLC